MLKALVKLLQAPLGGAKAQPLGRSALDADGGAPNLVDGGRCLLGGEARASDAGFESVEDGAPAFDGDAVEGGEAPMGRSRASVSSGMMGDGDAGELRWEDA